MRHRISITAAALVALVALAPGVARADDDPWAAGVAALEKRRAALESERSGGDDRGPPKLERVASKQIDACWPSLRFYRIELSLPYYKPGMRWAGSLFAIEKGKAEPKLICRVGHTSVDEAGKALLALPGQPVLGDAAAVLRFLAAWESVLDWFERDGGAWGTPKREGDRWRVAREDGSERVVVTLDGEGHPTGVARE